MFSGLRCGECWVLRRIYYVNRQLCYLAASKAKSKQGRLDPQITIAFKQAANAVPVRYFGKFCEHVAFCFKR
jgi:hypothetical protein